MNLVTKKPLPKTKIWNFKISVFWTQDYNPRPLLLKYGSLGFHQFWTQDHNPITPSPELVVHENHFEPQSGNALIILGRTELHWKCSTSLRDASPIQRFPTKYMVSTQVGTFVNYQSHPYGY